MTTTMIGVERPRDEQEQPRGLVHYRVEDGVGFIELDNPPANTYTFDVMRKLDDAIVKARSTTTSTSSLCPAVASGSSPPERTSV